MPDNPAMGHQASRYEIQLQGRLGPQWATRFEGMTLCARDDGTTVLEGPVVDQSALHGLLRLIGALGIPLLSLRQTSAGSTTHPDTTVQGD